METPPPLGPSNFQSLTKLCRIFLASCCRDAKE